MLNRRHIHRELRRQNKSHGKIKKKKSSSRQKFESALRIILDKIDYL